MFPDTAANVTSCGQNVSTKETFGIFEKHFTTLIKKNCGESSIFWLIFGRKVHKWNEARCWKFHFPLVWLVNVNNFIYNGSLLKKQCSQEPQCTKLMVPNSKMYPLFHETFCNSSSFTVFTKHTNKLRLSTNWSE